MVKLDLLDYFSVYYYNPPMILPEDTDRKKHCTITVLAPTMIAGFSWFRNTPLFRARSLSKYFLPKKWKIVLRGTGNTILTPDKDGEITRALNEMKTDNLKSVDGVTSYLVDSGSKTLRDLNCYLDVNFITEAVLNNPKDKRTASLKGTELVLQLQKYLDAAFGSEISPSFLGNYTKHTVIIPFDLWFTPAELKNPDLLFKISNRNIMAQVIRALLVPSHLSSFGDVVLSYGRVAMKMNTNGIPTDTPDAKDFIKDAIVRFVKKATAKNPAVAETEPEEKSDAKLAEAERATAVDAAVDQTLTAVKVDPDNVSEETRKEISKKIEKDPHASDPNQIHPETTVTEEEADILMKAKFEGRSAASQKRNELLKEKYKQLKIGSTSLDSIVESEETYEIKPVETKSHTINPMLKQSRAREFERAYNENLAQHHLVNILLHFSKISPALYLNRDIKVTDASTPTDRMIRYDVEFEDEDRKRHRFHFFMPKMYKDKYLYLNDMEMNISHQKFPYPITKTAPDRVQLVTNYNKVFSERYGSNISPRITKIKKILSSGDCSKSIHSERGDGTILNRSELTTVEYDEISTMVTKIQISHKTGEITSIYLICDHARAAVTQDPPSKVYNITHDAEGNQSTVETTDPYLIPVAIKARRGSKEKTFYYLSGKTNLVYDQKGNSCGEFSEFITQEMILADPKLDEILASTSAGSRFIYSRTKIMGEWIPTVIVAAAADPGGLTRVLEKAKIEYSFVEKRPRVNPDITAVIPFKDGYLVYDRYPFDNSLLLNGLLSIPTKEFSFYDMGSRDTYVDILELITGRRTLFDGIRNFYYLMVDPITYEVLERLRMPTDFTTLLLYCVGTLNDNTFQIDSDYNNSRVRSNEIINVYLYKELATAWEKWRTERAEKFSIREDAVIKALMEVQIVDPHSRLNVTLEAENDSLIKLKGPVGMNEDHSFTLEKRAYHPSMAGLIAMNSVPSGEVGIGRHLTMNANIDDALGFITVGKDDYDGTELSSVGEMLQVFATESSDIERVAMAISQAKHLVPVEDQTSNLISFDMDRTVPYISNDFSFCAKQDGKVVEVKDDVMIIQYKDGTYDDVDLSRHPDANVDGGFYIMNQLVAQVRPGASFKKGDILAYDPKYINSNDMFGDPCANIGGLARIAFMANGGVYEDSGFITDEFAHRMGSRITIQKRVILSKFANVKYIVKVGQDVKTNDPLLTFDDTADEFSSQLLQSIAEEQDEDEIIATNAPILSKVTGKVVDIAIYHSCPTKDMTPSMKKLVETYDSVQTKRAKTIGKYRSVSDANTIVRPGDTLAPDKSGKVKGVPLPDGVMIDFYVEYIDIMAPGDKTSASALKATQSFVIPTEYAPYTESWPERKIDMAIASIGMYKRMCLDVVKVGGLTKLLIEVKRQHKNKYLDRIRAQRKKSK